MSRVGPNSDDDDDGDRTFKDLKEALSRLTEIISTEYEIQVFLISKSILGVKVRVAYQIYVYKFVTINVKSGLAISKILILRNWC